MSDRSIRISGSELGWIGGDSNTYGSTFDEVDYEGWLPLNHSSRRAGSIWINQGALRYVDRSGNRVIRGRSGAIIDTNVGGKSNSLWIASSALRYRAVDRWIIDLEEGWQTGQDVDFSGSSKNTTVSMPSASSGLTVARTEIQNQLNNDSNGFFRATKRNVGYSQLALSPRDNDDIGRTGSISFGSGDPVFISSDDGLNFSFSRDEYQITDNPAPYYTVDNLTGQFLNDFEFRIDWDNPPLAGDLSGTDIRVVIRIYRDGVEVDGTTREYNEVESEWTYQSNETFQSFETEVIADVFYQNIIGDGPIETVQRVYAGQ